MSFWFHRDKVMADRGGGKKGLAPKQKFRTIYVIDFEATCNGDRRSPLRPQEIIEFPCVRLDTKTFKPTATFHEYVRPVHHARLTHFCTELTGITQETVDAADAFPRVFGRFQAWLGDHDEDDSVFLTLGDWDFKTMLPDQCRLSGLTLPPRFRQWVNVKRSFQTCQGYFPRSMRSMLDDLNIPLVGRHHSGIDDVNNIVSIVQSLALSEKGCVYDVTGRIKDNPCAKAAVLPKQDKQLV